MLTSYSFSERYNAQTLLWGIGGAIVSTGRLLSSVVGRTFAIVSHIEPYALGGAVGLVLGLGMFAVISAIPVTFWAGLLITGAFAWATFPRSKARPAKCPYCKGSDIDAGRGWAECRDCGKTWSY